MNDVSVTKCFFIAALGVWVGWMSAQVREVRRTDGQLDAEVRAWPGPDADVGAYPGSPDTNDEREEACRLARMPVVGDVVTWRGRCEGLNGQ